MPFEHLIEFAEAGTLFCALCLLWQSESFLGRITFIGSWALLKIFSNV